MNTETFETTNTEEKSPLLNANTIRQALEIDIELKDTEAANILERHLNTEYVHISNREPNSSDLEKAMTTANNFLKTNLYDHISETNCPEYLKLEPIANLEAIATKIDSNILKNLKQAKKQKPISHNADANFSRVYIFQGKETESDYCMYLSPHLVNVGAVLKDLIVQMPDNSAYQMKVVRGQEYPAQLSGRHPITMTFPKSELDNVVNAVNKLIEEKPLYFKNRPIPPKGKYSPHDGISFAKEIKQTSETLILEGEIHNKLFTELEQKARNTLKNLRESGQDILKTEEIRILWNNYLNIENEVQKDFYSYATDIIPQNEIENTTKLYLSLFSDNTLRYCFGMEGKDFDEEARKITPNISEQTLDLLRYKIRMEERKTRVNRNMILIKTGLAIEILKKIRANEKVGDVIKENL